MKRLIKCDAERKLSQPIAFEYSVKVSLPSTARGEEIDIGHDIKKYLSGFDGCTVEFVRELDVKDASRISLDYLESNGLRLDESTGKIYDSEGNHVMSRPFEDEMQDLMRD